MPYTITDVLDFVRYHLVLSEDDPERSDANLSRLIAGIEELASAPLCRRAAWLFCDRCGTSVDTVLIHPEGHHYSCDGDFYCADCWASGEIGP